MSMGIAGFRPRPPTPEEIERFEREKEAIKLRSGKEIIAAMDKYKDPVHDLRMARLRDECSHNYPTYTRNDGIEACASCHVRLRDIGTHYLGSSNSIGH